MYICREIYLICYHGIAYNIIMYIYIYIYVSILLLKRARVHRRGARAEVRVALAACRVCSARASKVFRHICFAGNGLQMYGSTHAPLQQP